MSRRLLRRCRPKKLAGQSIALVGIDIASDCYVDATRNLKEIPEMEELYTSSGDHMRWRKSRAMDGDSLADVKGSHRCHADGQQVGSPDG